MSRINELRMVGVGWCTEKEFAELLVLLETLAGALEVSEATYVILGQGTPSKVRAALAKYREWK